MSSVNRRVIIIFTLYIINLDVRMCLTTGKPVHYSTKIKLVTTKIDVDMKDISCYKDDIAETVNENLLKMNRTIFFIESSCKGGLNSRQACSVEAAASVNPGWNVVVLFPGPLSAKFLKTPRYKQLTSFKNVHLARIDVKKFSKGNPLERLFVLNNLTQSTYPVQQSSNVLRILTLYKFGGVYLDLDLMVVRPLDSLPENFIGKQAKDKVNNAIIGISPGHIVGSNFTRIAAKTLASSFEPYKWGANGPALVERTLAQLCNTTHVPEMSADTCHGFAVLDPKVFYPISYQMNNLRSYFEDTDPVLGQEYTHHIWNKFSKNFKVPPRSMYARLARKFCPKVFKLFGTEFGS